MVRGTLGLEDLATCCPRLPSFSDQLPERLKFRRSLLNGYSGLDRHLVKETSTDLKAVPAILQRHPWAVFVRTVRPDPVRFVLMARSTIAMCIAFCSVVNSLTSKQPSHLSNLKRLHTAL